MATRNPFFQTWFNPSPKLVPHPSPAATSADHFVNRQRFAADSETDWFELIRDIVAVANSGGGELVIPVAITDHDVQHWMSRYALDASGDLSVHCSPEANSAATHISVGPAPVPVALSGNFYFRHGDASEPGTTADMRGAFERVIRRVRRRWWRGIRHVLKAPIADVLATREHVGELRRKRDLANLQPVRIVTDPDAPALQPQDVDHLYPWRQKDLLRELNTRLGRRALTTYDIQAVRRQHQLDERPEFVFNLPGAGRRYSPAFADWIMGQFGRDPEFFHAARSADQAMLRLRRQKPR